MAEGKRSADRINTWLVATSGLLKIHGTDIEESLRSGAERGSRFVRAPSTSASSPK